MDIWNSVGRRVLVFDGAMGTQLQARGLPPGGCPELWNLERPEAIESIHAEYVAAGAQILETNTFGAVPCRLAHYGLQDRVGDINAAAVALARRAAAGRALVAASVGPLGQFLEPLGDYSFDQAYGQYAAQAAALHRAQPDLIVVETIGDLNEMRAALLAMKDHAPGIPVVAQMTIDASGRSFTGTDPVTAVNVLQSLGAAVVGLNCSVGPAELEAAVRQMAGIARVPLSVQPNAGLPSLVDGRTTYPMGPEEFAAWGPRLVAAGAALVGGCCGTTPEHIRRLAAAVAGLSPGRPAGAATATGAGAHAGAHDGVTAFSSRTRTLILAPESLPVVIGERINPTGRKRLSADLRDGQFELVWDEARRQAAAGAAMLDVNCGVPGIDEAAAMAGAVTAVQEATPVPLVIDSPGPDVLAAGLRAFVGKALVNSFSGEPERLERVLPLARRWGAGVIGLTLDDKGIPTQAEERLAIARRLVAAAEAAGIHRSDIVIDVLTLTAGAQQEAARETLRAIRLVKEELGVATALGVSNVSFGLPQRPFLNGVFLAMALAQGLDMAIINPLDQQMMDTVRAARLFLNRDRDAREYVAAMAARTPAPVSPPPGARAASPPSPGAQATSSPAVTFPETDTGRLHQALYRAVVDGDKENILPLLEAGLAAGADPLALLNEALIPGLTEVGRLFGDGTYFLPQLLLSATAMKQAFQRLKPELQRQQSGQGHIGTIVLATVQGDIHDIGKNICAVLLENYGFRVIDLGRDVPNEKVVEQALALGADLVGLSALMTTTMPQMKRVIELFAQRGKAVPVLIGGAATSAAYAEEIGAAGYGRDAQEAVQEALRVLQQVSRTR